MRELLNLKGLANLTLDGTRKRIIKRTNEIKVGKQYFLSSFYDKDGAFVTVLSKSTEDNAAGWPSSVRIRIESVVGNEHSDYYKRGTIHTVNATNLYDKRSDASHTRKVQS